MEQDELPRGRGCHARVRYRATPLHEPFFVALGERVATLRKAHGLTQVQLAEHLGVAQQTSRTTRPAGFVY